MSKRAFDPPDSFDATTIGGSSKTEHATEDSGYCTKTSVDSDDSTAHTSKDSDTVQTRLMRRQRDRQAETSEGTITDDTELSSEDGTTTNGTTGTDTASNKVRRVNFQLGKDAGSCISTGTDATEKDTEYHFKVDKKGNLVLSPKGEKSDPGLDAFTMAPIALKILANMPDLNVPLVEATTGVRDVTWGVVEAGTRNATTAYNTARGYGLKAQEYGNTFADTATGFASQARSRIGKLWKELDRSATVDALSNAATSRYAAWGAAAIGTAMLGYGAHRFRQWWNEPTEIGEDKDDAESKAGGPGVVRVQDPQTTKA